MIDKSKKQEKTKKRVSFSEKTNYTGSSEYFTNSEIISEPVTPYDKHKFFNTVHLLISQNILILKFI